MSMFFSILAHHQAKNRLPQINLIPMMLTYRKLLRLTFQSLKRNSSISGAENLSRASVRKIKESTDNDPFNCEDDYSEVDGFRADSWKPKSPKKPPKGKRQQSYTNEGATNRFPFRSVRTLLIDVEKLGQGEVQEGYHHEETQVIRIKSDVVDEFFGKMASKLAPQKLRLYNQMVTRMQSEHASSDTFYSQLKVFIKKFFRDSELDELNALLQKCDKDLIRKFDFKNTIHFTDVLANIEERSIKNHLAINEIAPQSFRQSFSQIQNHNKTWFQQKEKTMLKQMIKIGNLNQRAEDDQYSSRSPSESMPFFNFEEFHSKGLEQEISKKKMQNQSYFDKFVKENSERMQGFNQSITFTRTDSTPINQKYGQDWIYAFALPYQLTQQITNEFIKKLQSKYGKIDKVLAFPYKNMIQKHNVNYKYILPEEINIHSETPQIIRQRVQANQQKRNKGKKKQKPDSTDKYLNSIKSHQGIYLNKSYILFKFKNKDSVNKLLTQDMRIFGMQLKDKLMVKFESANNKKTVMVNRIPWAVKIGDLQEWMNNHLVENGYANIRCECSTPNKLLSKSYIYFNTNSFWESLKVIQSLNGKELLKSTIKVQHTYGNLRKFGDKFSESLSAKMYEDLKYRLEYYREQRLQHLLEANK